MSGLLGVHRNTVTNWINRGCPVVSKADRASGKEWQLSVPDVFEWRIKVAGEDAVASTGALTDGQITRDEADRRKAVAGAIISEVDADQALASVVSRFDAETTMADFAQALRAAFSNAAARIAGRAATLTDPNEIREFCEAEFNRSFEAGEAILDEKWENGTGHGDADSGEDFGA